MLICVWPEIFVADNKVLFFGLDRLKKCNFICINEYFEGSHNAEAMLFLQALISGCP